MSGEIRETLETRSTLVFNRRSNCRTYFLRRVSRYLSEEEKNDLVLILIFNFTIILFQYESTVFPFLKNFSLQFKERFGLSQRRLLVLQHILREVVPLGKPGVTAINGTV